MHGSRFVRQQIKNFLPAIVLVVLFGGQNALAQVKIIQPGPPGEPVRELSVDEATEIADNNYSPDDVLFMQDMIPHHHQATQMAALVGDRTNQPEVVEIAGRIDAAQADEIEFMQQWLKNRGEDVPDPSAHHAMHTHHDMAGMASPEEMQELADSEGIEFDRLFLKLMMAHHQGAVDMVEDLLERPGAAYDPVLYDFTSDITNDQTVEIERMNAIYAGLSDDPRSGLGPGIFDAEIAALNMKHVGFMHKAPGFFDPANPGELPLENPNDEIGEDEPDTPTYNPDERSPLLGFWYSDMAFFDDTLVIGGYHGINMYDVSSDGMPEHVSSLVCPGGQGDVSVVGDLLLMSVQDQRGRLDCGLQGVDVDASPERFRGLRIFDISDVSRPRQVGAVQTCRGSHTHSVVSSDDDTIVVYNSGTSDIRDTEELETCFDEQPGNDETALFRIDVIEVPVKDPSKARIVDSPTVFADDGQLAGLWRGGDHGDDTQDTNITDHCHDITVFPELNLAAGACSGNGILFDISDPLKPTRIDAVTDSGFAYWHSATFNNDGTKVLFTDEWGGGGRARCRVSDPVTWGADAIYDIVDGKFEFRSYYKLPAPQVEQENCVAHNGAIIPVPGRDIFVQAWYQGGISVVDFTDSANPVEIAYFDRGPIDAEYMVGGGFWSTYWYKGRIYGTEMVRGLDVLEMVPSEYLTANEIEAAKLADYNDIFNPQQQIKLTWPADPVVMHALVDQLERSGDVSDVLVENLRLYVNELDLGANGNKSVATGRLKELVKGLPSSNRSAKKLSEMIDQIG
ncbi:MAG: DUF305 domain-containing protein [Pseudomonadota bacterium]